MAKSNYEPFSTIEEFRAAYPALRFVQHRRSLRLYSIVSVKTRVDHSGNAEYVLEIAEIPCNLPSKPAKYVVNFQSIYEDFFIPQKGTGTWIGRPVVKAANEASMPCETAMTYDEFLASGITHVRHKRDGSNYLAVLEITRQGLRLYGGVNYRFVSYAELAKDWIARNNVTRAKESKTGE